MNASASWGTTPSRGSARSKLPAIETRSVSARAATEVGRLGPPAGHDTGFASALFNKRIRCVAVSVRSGLLLGPLISG